MGSDAIGSDFFKAGGTLHPSSPSYVRRPADDELFEQVMAGQFCYVLTSRQMGKSSLMIRTAQRLELEGIRTAIVDLSGIGTQVTRVQWYLGLIKRLTGELELSVEPEIWWHERDALGPVQRFTDFLRDEVLHEIDSRIVIFIDEIDSTLKLEFADDFFAAIRVMYNLRANNPEYNRLTLVLLGVAAPVDLVKAPTRTPFNIGRPVDLHEFSRQDAQPLERGLEQMYPGQGQEILDRIYNWTNGHPYLTQKLCVRIAEASEGDWQNERVDELVETMFLAEGASKEDNLQFVRGNVEASPERRHLLQLYRRVYEGEVVREDERSVLQNRLRLIGLVRAEGGALHVRNEIYRQVFNQSWIRENMPLNWVRIITVGSIVISVFMVVFGMLSYEQQREQEVVEKTQVYVDGFRGSTNADVQVVNLAGLCRIGREENARMLFFEQNQDQRLDMFRRVKARGAGEKLIIVADCLYPSITERLQGTEQQDALSEAMCCALYRLDREQGEDFSRRIGHQCRCKAEPE